VGGGRRASAGNGRKKRRRLCDWVAGLQQRGLASSKARLKSKTFITRAHI
jgi:hypothetical protein